MDWSGQDLLFMDQRRRAKFLIPGREKDLKFLAEGLSFFI